MDESAAAWTRRRGGRFDGDAARFEVERPAEVVALVEAATQAGLELLDVSMRRPTLESVFLHWTGRELRE
jgi:ABC-2 type transport system ATP-binding protein